MIKSMFISLVLIMSALILTAALPRPIVYAQDAGDAVCDTLGQVTGNSCESVDESGVSIQNVVEGALNLLTFVAGMATVVMVIIAGVKYVTSQGDSAAIGNAKATLLYALVGIVIVLLSQTIIFFFVGNTT